jgi:hypothetical protein
LSAAISVSISILMRRSSGRRSDAAVLRWVPGSRHIHDRSVCR